MSESRKIHSVFVGNIPFDVTESELDQCFQNTPNYVYGSIAKDGNGKSKGFGFLHFDDELSARKVMRSSDGMTIHGRKVFCRWGTVIKDDKLETPTEDPELQAARQSDKEWQQSSDKAYHSKENGKSNNFNCRRKQRKRARRHDSDYDDYDYDRKRVSHYPNSMNQSTGYNQYNTDRMVQMVLNDPVFSIKLKEEVERQRQMQGYPQQQSFAAQYQYQPQNPGQPMFMHNQGMQSQSLGQIPVQNIQMPPVPPIPPSQMQMQRKQQNAYNPQYTFQSNQNSNGFTQTHGSLQQQLYNQMNQGQNNFEQILNNLRFMSRIPTMSTV